MLTVSPILHDVKYYFVFTGSMLNPVLYGFNSATMRKAFVITFPFLFRKVDTNYVLKRDGRRGFSLIMDRTTTKNSPIHKAIVEAGLTGIAPISSRGQRMQGGLKVSEIALFFTL